MKIFQIPLLLFLNAIFNSFFLNAATSNCEVLQYHSYYEITGGKLIVTDSIELQINNRKGELYAEINLQYNRNSPITDLSAHITDNQGNIIRNLKSKEVTDANAVTSSFYSDEFTKSFTLKHTTYPYRVCYSYKVTHRQFFYIAFWNPVIGYEVPTKHAKLQFNHPRDLDFKIWQNRVDPPTTVTESGNEISTWTCSYNGDFKPEAFGPDPAEYMPGIRIVPIDFQYGFHGSNASWQAFGEWQYRLTENLDILPESECRIVHSLIENITDKREKVRVLYEYLQSHTRYIDVQINLGGLKPYPASYVSQNRYGDCKALTIYMKALLKCAGIESFYTLVYAGIKPKKFYYDLPSQQFNHALLTVPMGSDTLWLETTSNCNPYDYVHSQIQNRPALLINDINSRLIRIPANEKIPGRTADITYKFDETGRAEVMAVFQFMGDQFETINYMFSNYNAEDQRTFLQRNLPFDSYALNNWEIAKYSPETESIRLIVKLAIDNYSANLGGKHYFSVQPLEIPEFEKPGYRCLPVEIPTSISFTDTLRYRLFTDGTFIEGVPDKTIESKYGYYSIHYRFSKSELTIVRNFVLCSGTIPVNDYEAFFNFLTSVGEEEKRKILYQ